MVPNLPFPAIHTLGFRSEFPGSRVLKRYFISANVLWFTGFYHAHFRGTELFRRGK
jgi:hypothetical protein